MSWGRLIVAWNVLLLCATSAADEPLKAKGAALFAKQCAECHGRSGEGTTDNYPQPLFGDRSIFELAEVISSTMPEGEPELCVGDDAKAIAAWMIDEFYSPEAQARINPPQRKLSRLTVSQYRNCVADLAQSFTWFNQPDEKRGLRTRYYKTRRFRKKDQVIERLEPFIEFNYGEGTPDAEKIPESKEFSIHAEGSIIIDETGWYDFAVHTENGAKLYVNDHNEPLINAWVQSGDDHEHTGRIFLLAGRIYHLQLEWFTFQEKTASVQLLWKPPHGVLQTIPTHRLSPQSTPSVLVVETPFPPDDRNDGYIRGTAVSPEWDEATTFAAIEVADKLPKQLREFAKLRKEDNDAERRRKVREFCEKFAFRAFRRPLDAATRKRYVDTYFDGELTLEDALRRCILAVLKSPRFLYRNVTQQDDLYTRAANLSFALNDSLPPPGVLQAAEKQWIKSDKGLRDFAWKLMNSFRGRTHQKEFLRVWLNLERLEEVDKDREVFDSFTPELAADLRASLNLKLGEVVKQREGGLQFLLENPGFAVNERLAEFYGIESNEMSPHEFRRVIFEENERGGVISHPFMLAALAYRDTSSPIHRGVFLSRGLLGRTLKPPPDSVSPVAPDLEPHLTTRERVTKQTSPALCSTCHTMINALGFALENFDAVGRYRAEEKGKKVDASGGYRLRSGDFAKFRGAAELAAFLASNTETHRSFSRQLFHFMVQQPILAYGSDRIDRLSDFFVQHQFDITQLMVEVAVESAKSVKNAPSTPTASRRPALKSTVTK